MHQPSGTPTRIPLIKELEQVQRRAARFVFNNYQDTSPVCVTSLLDKLQKCTMGTTRAETEETEHGNVLQDPTQSD